MDRVVIAQKDNFYCNSESSENSFEGDNNDDFYKVRKGEWSYLRVSCFLCTLCVVIKHQSHKAICTFM